MNITNNTAVSSNNQILYKPLELEVKTKFHAKINDYVANKITLAVVSPMSVFNNNIPSQKMFL